MVGVLFAVCDLGILFMTGLNYNKKLKFLLELRELLKKQNSVLCA